MRLSITPIISAALLALGLSGRVTYAEPDYTLITLLHTNDMHGQVMPPGNNGGLVRLATIIRQVRAEMPNVLLLDVGDIIHGSPEDYYSGGKATITAMNATGYQVAVTGNHDFDFGQDTLEGAISTAAFPFIAANLRTNSGGQWNKVEQYRIIEIAGVRIAVLGLTTLEAITLQWPANMNGIRVDDPIATAQTMIPEMRKLADVVVVLSHLGAIIDTSLARQVPGIDFIIGAHSHTVIDDWRWIGDTLITQTGAYARALGRIDFIVRTEGDKPKIVSVNGKGRTWNSMPRPPFGRRYPDKPLIWADDKVAVDPAVEEAYKPFRVATDARLAEVLGSASAAIPGRSIDEIETPAADLVADAVRAFALSDIALIDTKSVSNEGLPAGPLTARSLFNLINGYTRQQIIVGKLTGAELKTALDREFAAKRHINLAISGAAFEYDLKNGVPQISDILIAGVPLDPTRSYTVATQAYVMMSLMEAVPGIVITAESRETTREALMQYVKGQGTVVSPPEARVRTKVQRNAK